MTLAAREKEDGWRFVLGFREACEERLRPESPDLRRCDDERAEGLVFVRIGYFIQARVKRTEKICADDDVVVG